MSPRSEPLTRGQIVEAALEIADREGLEQLSMRRVGRAKLTSAGADDVVAVGEPERDEEQPRLVDVNVVAVDEEMSRANPDAEQADLLERHLGSLSPLEADLIGRMETM